MTYVIVIILIALSAFFSGLTLGLMGLDKYELKRKVDLGNNEATKVYPLRKQGNLLLTTLLVGNVAVNSALSIFLGSIASGLLAGIMATILIVIFGEIIPQAIFSRFALRLGAKVAWFVQFLIYAFYPITKPIAWVLDKTLGDELPTVYSKQELVKIIEEHEDASMSDVDEAEERIIKGALTFSDKLAADIMTPRTVVTSFDEGVIVDEELYKEVKTSGYSRYPVYSGDKENIVGVLYRSTLVGNSAEGKQINTVMSKDVYFLNKDDNLDDVLEAFLKLRRHIAIVKDEFGGMAGVVTLEDVLEEILKKEIVDESDQHEDMRKFAKAHKKVQK